MVVPPVTGVRPAGDAPPRERGTGWWPRPRVRRPVDVTRLVVAAVLLAGLVALAAVDGPLVRAAHGAFGHGLTGTPRVVVGAVNVVASLAVLVVLVLLAVRAARTRPFAVVGAVTAVVGGLVLGPAGALVVAATAGHAVARTLLTAGLPVTTVVAAVVGADVHQERRLGTLWTALAVSVVGALASGDLAPPGAVYALLVGAVAGWGARVALGVVPARPPDDVVTAALVRAGWPVGPLRAVEQQVGRRRYVAPLPDGDALSVTVVDPDRRGVSFVRPLARVLRLRTAAVGRPPLSARGGLEREALACALAVTAGVAAPRVLALLEAGDAVVSVRRPLHGTPLITATVGDDGVGDAVAAAAFTTLRRLHDAGLAHGALGPADVVVLDDGRVGFTDLEAAQPAATDLQRELDVAALLVTVALQVGDARAVSALGTAYGVDARARSRLAALLTPAALPAPVRRVVRGTPHLDALRTALTAGGTPGDLREPLRLERLRARTVISVVGGTVAVYILAGQLSTVDLASVVRDAHPGWLAVAVGASAVTYVGSALALEAFVPRALSFARTCWVQVAASFLALVTPPAVGHVGLNIRYLQRSGVATATAAGVVAVKESVTVVLTVVLVVVCGWLSGVSGSRLALLPSGDVLLVLAVAAGVLVVALAVPATRRVLRRRVEPLVRQTLPQLLASVSDPRRGLTATAGVLLLNAGYVLALDASLRAFSVSVAIPTLVVAYLAASTLGSVAPTPGGLGAVEAALVGALTATGVPVAAAVTAVIAFRGATFWLPAPVGGAAFVVLQRRERI